MSRFSNFVDRLTKLPGQVSKKSDEINDKLISVARDLQNAVDNSATIAERNLKQSKIRSIGSNAAEFISKNLQTTGGLIVAGIVIILILRK